MSQIALVFVFLQKEPVVVPIIGTTEISYVNQAVGALDIKLTLEEILFLQEPYYPHPLLGMFKN